MLTDKISVIIPVYNGENTIKETIESVLNQTFTNFELIIINANSTDKTLSIISQLKDERIKVFFYPKANVAVNRNRGINHAIGNYITFLDADDLWTTDKLAAQYTALQSNSQAGVAYSWTNCIDENSKFLRKTSHVNWNGDVYANFLLDDFIGNGSNVMIRREVLMKVNGFDEILTNAQDTDMWLKLSAITDFVCVPKAQILYRIRQDSMSSNVLGLEKSNLEVIQRAFSREQAKQYQHLKPQAIGNLYKYLCYKVLAAPPGKQQGKVAARFLLTAIKTDMSLLFKPIIFKAIFKLIVMVILPSNWATTLFKKLPRLSNTSTFLGYEKIS
ncbi:MAG: glycosyltransferase [Richelia sp. RM2_1_2]|nr:glycosyltransferase [Richelia sp. RM1_1_1]NJO28705.1 glycosyltransferase [Richelia sp. SL_2_1]NJO62501.1 glycosyltransferase [Richelia sp. RM2_1_2]